MQFQNKQSLHCCVCKLITFCCCIFSAALLCHLLCCVYPTLLCLHLHCLCTFQRQNTLSFLEQLHCPNLQIYTAVAYIAFRFNEQHIHYIYLYYCKENFFCMCCCSKLLAAAFFLFALLCASPSCHHAAVHNFLLLHFSYSLLSIPITIDCHPWVFICCCIASAICTIAAFCFIILLCVHTLGTSFSTKK